jgi:hypothetical protein
MSQIVICMKSIQFVSWDITLINIGYIQMMLLKNSFLLQGDTEKR